MAVPQEVPDRVHGNRPARLQSADDPVGAIGMTVKDSWADSAVGASVISAQPATELVLSSVIGDGRRHGALNERHLSRSGAAGRARPAAHPSQHGRGPGGSSAYCKALTTITWRIRSSRSCSDSDQLSRHPSGDVAMVGLALAVLQPFLYEHQERLLAAIKDKVIGPEQNQR